ncbi:MAG: hypothetical protein A2428_05485 [Bdellovibrionales bacterium RIFOXYC1_FULL_54_43]|nr:MAG: hypothetical protein A2428_05485 [Bdellovibrionales bacterium RIFOXYC1_FULL_54_43]OFZ80979.1 MAG: hypothetical protein A2603_16410 [Bdellovibrionales bacterium RIFOXYD1_FULL_55_31]
MGMKEKTNNTKTTNRPNTTSTLKTTTAKATTTNWPTHEQIAARAYGIYKSGKAGTPQEHWLQAERELKNTTTR